MNDQARVFECSRCATVSPEPPYVVPVALVALRPEALPSTICGFCWRQVFGTEPPEQFNRTWWTARRLGRIRSSARRGPTLPDLHTRPS